MLAKFRAQRLSAGPLILDGALTAAPCNLVARTLTAILRYHSAGVDFALSQRWFLVSRYHSSANAICLCAITAPYSPRPTLACAVTALSLKFVLSQVTAPGLQDLFGV